jgi:hypothetical protein
MGVLLLSGISHPSIGASRRIRCCGGLTSTVMIFTLPGLGRGRDDGSEIAAVDLGATRSGTFVKVTARDGRERALVP